MPTNPKARLVDKQIAFCLFEEISKYIATRPTIINDTDQFFVFSNGSKVTPNHARKMLKTLIKCLNLQEELHTIHGFRGGRVIDLFNLGISVETIIKIGRWKSNAVFTYLHY